MGMDGLSMSNTGALREATSRDYSAQTKEAVQKNEQNKQVDKLDTNFKVKEDGHNGSNGKQNQDKNKKQNDESATYEETAQEVKENNTPNEKRFADEDIINQSFYVKIEKSGNIFELYDKSTNRLIEKIDASEISQLMSKLNMASGIIVNRSI